MPKPLDFTAIDEDSNVGENDTHRRWLRREANPTIQMSIRMGTSDYDKFRELCKRERRTNGDMVQVLMESYLKHSK